MWGLVSLFGIVLSEHMPIPRVLLLIPPLTQLNTPYPSTAHLTGFLRSRGIDCKQADLGIEMVLRLFSRSGMQAVFDRVRLLGEQLPPPAVEMLSQKARYLDRVDMVVGFLQGRHPAVARRIVQKGFLPQGPRFIGKVRASAGLSVRDRAKHWATLFIEDLADLVQATVAPHFALNRYADQLARSASSFDPVLKALSEPPSLTDSLMLEALALHLESFKPSLVGLSVPFPGNLYGALRIAQAIKRKRPQVTIAMGGGYVNTELRRLSDPRVFDFVDHITLDDGELPLLSLIEYLSGKRLRTELVRTMSRENNRVVFFNKGSQNNVGIGEIGCPTYHGLPLDRYLTILDSANPMHRLWSEGHWNKLMVAHGCYWKQCTFCDVGLDYIARYEMAPTERLIQQINLLIAETSHRTFHFVDEAAPPAALKALALGLIENNIRIRWWGNIRFEEAFTPDLCRLLAASGCIAVTAGLEAASDRLLKKMKKGISVDQAARVASAFRRAGIMVHAYLMYGFPSETIQETVDSLERVRQLFALDLIQSAFWHRFTLTAHSPIGQAPATHGIKVLRGKFEGFAENDLAFYDKNGVTPDWISEGLRRSMLNFLEGKGLRMDVRGWFDRVVPRPHVTSTWAATVTRPRRPHDALSLERRLVWIGEDRIANAFRRSSTLSPAQTRWLAMLTDRASPVRPNNGAYPLWRDVQASYPEGARAFQRFLGSPMWRNLRETGLLLV